MLTDAAILKQETERPTIFLNMYDEPMVSDLSFSTVCKLGDHRVQALKAIQQFFEKRKDNESRDRTFYDDLAEAIRHLEAINPALATKENDIVSHWICKTAFSVKDLDTSFFPFYEKILFAGRLWIRATNAAIKIIEGSGRPAAPSQSQGTSDPSSPEPIETLEEERNKVLFDFLCQYIGVHAQNCKKTIKDVRVYRNKDVVYEPKEMPYLMVPFRFALKAMETYDAEMWKGRAQITPYTAFMVIQDLFEEALKIHKKCLLASYNGMVEAEPRLAEAVRALMEYKAKLDETNEVFFSKGQKFDQLEAESVHKLVPYFPLCMLETHDALRKNHSLKHFGRLQFTSFLKGLGMDVKQAVRLFTLELNRTEKGRKQVKEYTYLIEHMYGLQGKKTDYTPWSCQKIIGKAIPQGNDVYGCPYRYFSDQALGKLLRDKKGLTENLVSQVLDARKLEPQLGCRKLFELTHPGAEVRKGVGKHPNAYFQQSYAYSERMSHPGSYVGKKDLDMEFMDG